MGRTIVEQIFGKRAGRSVRSGETVLCSVDFAMVTDTTGPLAIQAFKAAGGQKVHSPEKISFILDHASPSPNQKVGNIHSLMRAFAREQGIFLHEVGEGICHQLVIENHYVSSGMIAVGADSHTCTYGAVGAFSTGMGSTDLGAIMLTGQSWFKVPETIRVVLHNKMPAGVSSKDAALSIVKEIGAEGANYQSLEFSGDGLEQFTLADKMTLCNMSIEMGAKNGMICDATTGLASEKNARFKQTVELDLSGIEPVLSCPHQVDNVHPVSEYDGTPVHQGFLGSCTNGRLQDLETAAQILRGKKIHPDCRLLITPASRSVLLEAIKSGCLTVLIEAGASVTTPGCGVCVGTHNGVPGDKETVISTSNRNFVGRMGNKEAKIFLASPATVAASVLYGKITSPKAK